MNSIYTQVQESETMILTLDSFCRFQLGFRTVEFNPSKGRGFLTKAWIVTGRHAGRPASVPREETARARRELQVCRIAFILPCS